MSALVRSRARHPAVPWSSEVSACVSVVASARDDQNALNWQTPLESPATEPRSSPAARL